MSYSFVRYTGNGSTKNFSVTFQYLDKADVVVTVDGATMTNGVDYTWVNSSTVQLNSAPAANSVVEISRNTTKAKRLVDFNDASVLTEADLDKDANQLFYLLQEANDTASNSIQIDANGRYDADYARIVNVGDPVDSLDAVNLRTIQVTYPGILTVAGNIVDVQTLANDLNSIGFYEMDLGSITQAPTLNPNGTTSVLRAVADNMAAIISAYTNITAILNAATNAADAASSASAAATSASNASTYANNALTYKTNAATSATNAATSEANALSYKNAAATSATNAATSETNALSSKNAAATSATNAATSATNAASSATSASTSASNASTSATNAASSATSASTSATNAASSATLAADWAAKTSGTVNGTEYSAKYWAQQAAATIAAGAADGSITSAKLASILDLGTVP